MSGQNTLVIASTGIIWAILAGAAGAATFYTDRASWEAAMAAAGVGSLVTETFDQDIANNSVITFESGVQSTGTNGQGTNDVLDGAYGGNVDSDKDAVDVNTNEPLDVFESITWRFPTPIIGFGADFIEAATGEVLLLSGNFDGTGEQIIDFSDVLGDLETGFFGVVGTSPFQEITFRSRTDDSSERFNEFWLTDNLSFGSVKSDPGDSNPPDPEPIPEPFSPLAVLAFGAAAMGRVLKKKK